MPKSLELLSQRITEAYSSWREKEETTQKNKINLILPIIQAVSYLEAIHRLNNDIEICEGYKGILDDFAQQYQIIFGHDVSTTNHSDIERWMAKIIMSSQFQGEQIDNTTRMTLLESADKYLHANNRVMYSYGDFLKTIHASQNFDEAKRKEIADRFAAIKESENHDEVLAQLVEINRAFGIEPNSTNLSKDDLENHALLNQLSNWLQHIAEIPALMLDDRAHQDVVRSFMMPLRDKNISIDRHSIEKQEAVESLRMMKESLSQKSMSGLMGFETEFLVLPKDKMPDINQMSKAQQNITMKTVLADINSRGYMQEKYGLKRSVPVIYDNRPFLFRISRAEAENELGKAGIISEADYRMITTHLEEYLGTKNISVEEKEDILSQVVSFTPAEVLFYKIFFLENNQIAFDNRIEMDDVSSPAKTEAEIDAKKRADLDANFEMIRTGRLQERMLDMIEASEVSFGPYEFDELIQRKDKAISDIRRTAQESNSEAKNPNVQLNLSLAVNVGSEADPQMRNIFMPRIIGEGTQARMYSNALAREISLIIQEEVASCAQTTGILRNQTYIDTTYDRKKTIGAKPNTPLWPREGENPQDGYLAIDEKHPAFLNHKLIAAKTNSLRISVINYANLENAEGIAVLEIRLVGNNSHLARSNHDQTVDSNGIDFIPEEIMHRISKRIGHFVDSKSQEELKELVLTDVEITKQGKITGLEPTTVDHKILRDNPYKTVKEKFLQSTGDFLDRIPNNKTKFRAEPSALQYRSGTKELF